MNSSEEITRTIEDNASQIARLHARVHETFARRGVSDRHASEWRQACAEFHKRYNALAFPGGYRDAFERIASGDALALEAVVCFLEVRPYFFRSGYMFKALLRRAKRAPLSDRQAARLRMVVENYDVWRRSRQKVG